MSPRRPASHRTLRAVAIVVVMVAPSLLACGGKDLDVGYDDTAIANVNPAAPVDMNAVHARCGAPGTDAPFDFSVPAVTVLTGRWFLCEGTDPAALAAIELTAEKKWFALVANDSGVYVRDSSHAGVYATAKTLSCCYPDTLVITFDPKDLSFSSGYFVTFRRGPRQMTWAPSSSNGGEPRPTVARFVQG